MSYTQVGHCPKCGAPIYSPMEWHGTVPPPAMYTCVCFQVRIVTNTDSSVPIEIDGNGNIVDRGES